MAAALFSFSAGAQDTNLCTACHGHDGNSTTAGTPSIAGQPKIFLETQLVLFREGVRVSDQMNPVTRPLKDADIGRLAEHFSKLPARATPGGPTDPARMKQGEAKARALRCGQCHLADFSGQAQIPRLALQREEYLEAEMRAYRDGKRSGGDSIMTAALHGVSDADITALAHFLSRSAPRPRK